MNASLHIITAYTTDIKNVSDLSYDSITNYCNKNNIKCNRYLLENLERHPVWYKIPLILSEFEKGAEYVMWIDADTMIVNFEFNILKILDDSKIYISKDINGINCGVMIWKNSKETFDILNKIWLMTEFDSHYWREQAAFISLYDENYNNIQSIIKLVEQGSINSYDYSLYGMNYPIGQVNDDSLLIHFPGLPNDRRFNLMSQYKRKI